MNIPVSTSQLRITLDFANYLYSRTRSPEISYSSFGVSLYNLLHCQKCRISPAGVVIAPAANPAVTIGNTIDKYLIPGLPNKFLSHRLGQQ